MATKSQIKLNNYNTISNNFFRNPLFPADQQENQNLNSNSNLKNYNSTQFFAGSGTNFYQSSQTQNQFFFSFKPRSGKLRWKEIMKLDFDNMVKTNDISALEAHLENLVFSSIEAKDVEIISENSTAKLIKIYQHVLEYLLNTQIRLENENKALELSYAQLQSESAFKENTLIANKSLISTLKHDKREKEIVMNTYKCLIDDYKCGTLSPPYNDFDNKNLSNSNRNFVANFNMKNSKYSTSSANAQSYCNNNYNVNENKQYFFCEYCSGKKFSSEENMNNHYLRRHANPASTTVAADYSNSKRKEIKKNSCAAKTNKKDLLDFSDLNASKRESFRDFENQIEELKNMFTNFMQNIGKEPLSKLAENQKALESEITDQQNDKEKKVNLLQENFKKTLIEIKEFIKNNNNKDSAAAGEFDKNNKIIQSRSSILASENEGIEAIKSNLTNMTELISELEINEIQKIQNVHEQLDSIKTAITDEFKVLKNSNYYDNNNNNYYNVNNADGNNNFTSTTSPHSYFSESRYNTNPIRNNRFRGESMEITNAYSISNFAVEKVESHTTSYIAPHGGAFDALKLKKPFFNAGPLESDYSDEESKRKKVFDSGNKEVSQHLIRKTEDQKVSSEKTLIKSSKANNNDNMNNKEQQQRILQNENSSIIEASIDREKSEKSTVAVENIKGGQAAEKLNAANDNKLKNKQKQKETLEENKPHDASDIASCDALADKVSNITKGEKTLKNNNNNNNNNNRFETHNNSANDDNNNKLQKIEDAEFIMDDVSEGKLKHAATENKPKEKQKTRTQKSHRNNFYNSLSEKENKKQLKKHNKAKAHEKELGASDLDKNKRNEEFSGEIEIKLTKTKSLAEMKDNQIQITNFKNGFNVENYAMESGNLSSIKSKFVEQFEEREKQFKIANVDLNTFNSEKDHLEFYKRVL